METIKDMTLGGERPLFAAHDVCLDNITITDGESGTLNLKVWRLMMPTRLFGE